MFWSTHPTHPTQNSDKEKVSPKSHQVHINHRRQYVSLSCKMQGSCSTDLFLKHGYHPLCTSKGLRVSTISRRAFPMQMNLIFRELPTRTFNQILKMTETQLKQNKPKHYFDLQKFIPARGQII